MSEPAWTQFVRNRVHECAPDSAGAMIPVGALRESAKTMAELYEALAAARDALWINARINWSLADFESSAIVQQIDAALARARTESPPSSRKEG